MRHLILTLTILIFFSCSAKKNSSAGIAPVNNNTNNSDTSNNNNSASTGTGTVNISLSWITGDVTVPSITATLTNEAGTSTNPAFNIIGDTASFNSGDLNTGRYILNIIVLDGATAVIGTTQVIIIQTDVNTIISIDFNKNAGTATINSTPVTSLADTITLTNTSAITAGKAMNPIADIDAYAGAVTYSWYLNGALLGTGTTRRVRAPIAGFYSLNVIAKNEDDEVIAQKDYNFYSTAVAIPEPLHRLTFSEGSGLTTQDSVSGIILTGQEASINWCSESIKERGILNYIHSGASTQNKGVLHGELITQNMTEYTYTFLTRISDPHDGSSGGAFVNFMDSGSLHFKFWGSTWDWDDMVDNFAVTNVAHTVYGKWIRLTYVQTATEAQIYVGSLLSGSYNDNNSILIGHVRLGAFSDTTDYLYPGEYTDIEIYNYAFSPEQVAQKVDYDGEDVATYSSLSNGSDFGGMWLNHDATVSSITIDAGAYQHTGPAEVNALSKLIPSGNPDLWFSADFKYPSSLTANHDAGGSAFNVITLMQSLNGKTVPIAAIYLEHTLGTNVLTLNRITYRNTAGGNITIPMDGREIAKDAWHNFEIHYIQGAAGGVAFYYNDEELYAANANMDLEVLNATYGLYDNNDGIGINPASTYYSDNIYVGINRLNP